MSPQTEAPAKEVLLKRTATSTRDLERVEVTGRVAQEGLKLVDAAAMLQLSYRKVKRMWRRYQQVGRQGMKHAHAGRLSNPNRGRPMKLRRRVLSLIKKTHEKIFRFGGRAIRPDLSRRAPG
jgi:transposase